MPYFNWLQRGAPSSPVEKYPSLNSKGESTLKGVYVAGDLTGMPLLKFAADNGSELVQGIKERGELNFETDENVYDIAIIGAGPAGAGAAIQAKKLGLNYLLLESNRPFSTIANFPKGKPIFLEPASYQQTGPLKMRSEVKEDLLKELQDKFSYHEIEITKGNVDLLNRSGNLIELTSGKETYKAKRVILAIGKSGNYRKLEVPGEDLSKVSNRLLDPGTYKDQELLIVGGGDSALEAAIACAEKGAKVTLSYRKSEFSRPKEGNQERLNDLSERGKIKLMMSSNVKKIEEDSVLLIDENKEEVRLKNDAVIVLIGSELPLSFFKKCGIRLENAMDGKWWSSFSLIMGGVTAFYLWKNNLLPGVGSDLKGPLSKYITFPKWMAFDAGVLYAILYCLLMAIFGFRRMKKTPTKYVKRQTFLLLFVQVVMLTLLPLVILPLLDQANVVPGWFKTQVLEISADAKIEGWAAWKVMGLILAWPLFPFIILGHIGSAPSLFWCIYTPLLTFGIIPLLIYFYGKGVYCGWICSCGGLAETLGDPFRSKTPHGPTAKKLENFGQILLWYVTIHGILIVSTWFMSEVPTWLYAWDSKKGAAVGLLASLYTFQKFFIDMVLAGIIGVGFYGHFGGRVWCRFACPLAALMHLYTKFSLYRIFADKSRCISCNVCTKVCHMGIDVMNFANKGKPMDDVECVRCSACVAGCPTNVLSFGRLENLSSTTPSVLETSSRMETDPEKIYETRAVRADDS